jgi:hypothetical protein
VVAAIYRHERPTGYEGGKGFLEEGGLAAVQQAVTRQPLDLELLLEATRAMVALSTFNKENAATLMQAGMDQALPQALVGFSHDKELRNEVGV